MAIAGLGVTMPITSLIIAFEMLVGIGASAVIAKKLGQNKKEEAEEVLGNAVVVLSNYVLLNIKQIGIKILEEISCNKNV